MSKDDLSFKTFPYSSNPIDMIEEMIALQEWPYHRVNPEAIMIEVPGRWGGYRMQFLWQKEIAVLQLTTFIEVAVPASTLRDLFELLNAINERIAIGHFEYLSDMGEIIYRHAVLLNDERGLTGDHIEDVVEFSFSECERFYPVFEEVLQKGKHFKEALNIALIDPIGEA